MEIILRLPPLQVLAYILSHKFTLGPPYAWPPAAAAGTIWPDAPYNVDDSMNLDGSGNTSGGQGSGGTSGHH